MFICVRRGRRCDVAAGAGAAPLAIAAAAGAAECKLMLCQHQIRYLLCIFPESIHVACL